LDDRIMPKLRFNIASLIAIILIKGRIQGQRA
jgi:hypothetical protein